MANQGEVRSEQDAAVVRYEAKFVSGWFTQQFEAGKHPEYGYPVNHLPETSSEAMLMVTGFVASDGK